MAEFRHYFNLVWDRVEVVFFLLLFSCYSNLEHRASMKRFVSLHFLSLRQSAGLLGQGISPWRRPLPNVNSQEAHTQICMPSVGSEPTIPFERAKTFHVLDSAATVIGGGSSTITGLKITILKILIFSGIPTQDYPTHSQKQKQLRNRFRKFSEYSEYRTRPLPSQSIQVHRKRLTCYRSPTLNKRCSTCSVIK
jgi:hypothetical protein